MNPRRRYGLVSFLLWFPVALSIPVSVLLMTSRGLSLAQVGLVMTVFSVVTLSLELPTGGLSDVIGRRRVLAASAAFAVAAFLLTAVAQDIWAFTAAIVLKAVARALSSGPAEAWYVDTLHAVEGPEADLRPGLALGNSMGSLALCLGVGLGGLVPLLAPGEDSAVLAVPVLLAAGAALVLLVTVLFALPEPPHPRRSAAAVLREVPATVVSGVRLAARGPVLRRLVAYSVVNGVALTSVELLTPGRLAELAGAAGLGSTFYAVVAALGFAGSAAGAALAPWAGRLLGGSGAGVRGVLTGALIACCALSALALTAHLDGTAGLVSASGAYVVLFVGLSLAGLFVQEMTHHAVTAEQRSTVTSVNSLSLQAGGALVNIPLGALAAAQGVAASWAVAAGLLLVSLLLFVRMPAARAAEHDSVTMGG
ncbi:MFS transporter [Nonomuraea sp. NPDC050310]|uniref:MFS transporter n=1 Tax=unclassified Nonomuraea TaxID=2593643 RepID=UPI0033F651B4